MWNQSSRLGRRWTSPSWRPVATKILSILRKVCFFCFLQEIITGCSILALKTYIYVQLKYGGFYLDIGESSKQVNEGPTAQLAGVGNNENTLQAPDVEGNTGRNASQGWRCQLYEDIYINNVMGCCILVCDATQILGLFWGCGGSK